MKSGPGVHRRWLPRAALAAALAALPACKMCGFGEMPPDKGEPRAAAKPQANRAAKGKTKGDNPDRFVLGVPRLAPGAPPPIIDGKPDEPVWQKAADTGLFGLSAAGRRQAPRFPTRAKALWDDVHLYIAFECGDDYAWGTHAARDAPIYDEEAVEIFLDPDNDGKTYYEIQIAPTGVIFDAFFEFYRSDLPKARAWNAAGMQAATYVKGKVNDTASPIDGWTAEFAIPFAVLVPAPSVPPAPGTQWRADFFRFDRADAQKLNFAAAWKPVTKPDFHWWADWGILRFDAAAAP